MDKLEELAYLMIKTGACVRALPETVREVTDARHAKDKCYEHPSYVKKEVRYLPQYKREMFVAERRPEHAGMFLLETGLGTMSGIRFSGKRYYGSLDEVLDALKESR